MTEANLRKLIGKDVRRARRIQDLTQEELAKKVKTSQSTIAQIEKGIKMPSVFLLWKINQLFGIN